MCRWPRCICLLAWPARHPPRTLMIAEHRLRVKTTSASIQPFHDLDTVARG